jgi:peptidyl-prolyl cis-trans isomerase A (cyclophilin A)
MRVIPLLLRILLAIGVALPVVAQEAAETPPGQGRVHVVLQTTLGNIRLGLDAQRAPVTTANFLRYVDEGRFNGIAFYRALKMGDEFGLAQAGLRGHQDKLFEPIAHESPADTGLSHTDGAISMARLDPGTATSDFFIVVGDLVSLDGNPAQDDPGYAVFGHVVDGMGVVRQILEQPRDPEAGQEGMKGQMLAEPVLIVVARRE